MGFSVFFTIIFFWGYILAKVRAKYYSTSLPINIKNAPSRTYMGKIVLGFHKDSSWICTQKRRRYTVHGLENFAIPRLYEQSTFINIYNIAYI